MTSAATRAFARALSVCAALAALSAEAAAPPAPTRWATDQAGFLSESVRQSLDAKLEEYQRTTGHHVLVWIARTSGGVPVEDFANAAFQAWRVGRKGIDDGVVLFVFSDDRKVRIEVGYGLEGLIPDAIASRIIQDSIIPKIRAGDRDGAVLAGVDGMIAAIEGKLSSPAAGVAAPSPSDRVAAVRPEPSTAERRIRAVLIALFWIGVVVFVITNPSLALYLLTQLLASSGSSSSSRSGGWSSGGGSSGGSSYSGGGGSSGGGGATGSW